MKLFHVLSFATVALWCVGVDAQPSGGDRLPEIVAANQVIATTGGSCEDVAKLKKLADTSTSQSAILAYSKAAESRRKAGIDGIIDILNPLRRFNDGWWILGDRDDGTHSNELTPDNALEDAKGKLNASRCYLAQDRQGKIDEFIANLDGLRGHFNELKARETKCRQNATCKSKRLAMRNARDLCQLYDQRDMLTASIKEEKSNPAGVVDLARLHGLGVDLQLTDGQIKEAKAEFTKATKAQFNRALCKELPSD